MSWEDRYYARSDYNSEIASEAIGDLSATDICDLFMTLDLSDEQCLEMMEALLQKVNNNGHTYKLVEGE